MRGFKVVGKVRVESGNSLETFALAKVSRSLPIMKLAISIPIWQGVPRQGWNGALPKGRSLGAAQCVVTVGSLRDA